MNRRIGTLGLFAILTIGAVAQSKPTSRPDYESEVLAWLSGQADESSLAGTVETVLAGGKAALRFVGRAIKAEIERAETNKGRVEQLVLRIAIGFHDRERLSGMFYAGQYEPLDPLQPFVGEVFLELLVGTPDWYPLELRHALVPALRDLYPTGPGAERRADLHAIATDERRESTELRHALAFAFAQWGRDELVAPLRAELLDSVGERETEDELYFSRRLAFFHYNLRDFRSAAAEWHRYLRGNEALELPPPPLDYYNAACSMSLAGRMRDALDELDRCAERLSSKWIDDSYRIERKLFDHDPELRAVRPTQRFTNIVDRIFGDEDR